MEHEPDFTILIILLTAHGRRSAEADVDLPVLIDNTGSQVVPGGISFHS
jgi:hypothetical protein